MCFKFTTHDFTAHDFATPDCTTQDCTPHGDQRPPAELRFVTPDCPVQAQACAARRNTWVEPARPARPAATLTSTSPTAQP